MIALSTCWNASRYRDGESVIEEIAELGFEAVELSHGLKLSMVEGLVKGLKKHPQIKVTSLHNFCPMPPEVMVDDPNAYQFSSGNSSERRKALEATRRTCEFAQQLGVKQVILHLGAVPMREVEVELNRLIFDGKFGSEKYRKIVDEARRERDHRVPKAWSHVQRCLPKLGEMAESFGVTFGVENQPHFNDLGFSCELRGVFSEFSDRQFQFWMDVGHAQIHDFMGFNPMSCWQEEFSRRLLGFHLHDVRFPCYDHQLPGLGDLQWEQLQLDKYPNAVKIWELGPNVPRYLVQENLKELHEVASGRIKKL